MKQKGLQYGALPFRRLSGEQMQILLISSLESRRWIIPKGWPKGGEEHEAAEREAFEEAGVLGVARSCAVGTYEYPKRRADGHQWICRVSVHLLEVLEEVIDWPEKKLRYRVWLPVEEAAGRVAEPELKRLIRGVPTEIAASGPEIPSE